jgi:hypothetical protein
MSFIFAIVSTQKLLPGSVGKVAAIVSKSLPYTLINILKKCPHTEKFELVVVVDGVSPKNKQKRHQTTQSLFVKIIVREYINLIWSKIRSSIEESVPNCTITTVSHFGEAEGYAWPLPNMGTIDIFETKALILSDEIDTKFTLMVSLDSDVIMYDLLNNLYKVDAAVVKRFDKSCITVSHMKSNTDQRYKLAILTLIVSFGCDYLKRFFTPSDKKKYFRQVEKFFNQHYDQYWSNVKPHLTICLVPLPQFYKLAFPLIWACIYNIGVTSTVMAKESDDFSAALISQWKSYNWLIDYVCLGRRTFFRNKEIIHIKSNQAKLYYQQQFNDMLNGVVEENIYIANLTICNN